MAEGEACVHTTPRHAAPHGRSGERHCIRASTHSGEGVQRNQQEARRDADERESAHVGELGGEARDEHKHVACDICARTSGEGAGFQLASPASPS
jgi:hypothetical protein